MITGCQSNGWARRFRGIQRAITNATVVIGHVRYISIQAWLRGFRVKIANFSSFFCLSIPKGDLHTKKTTPNIEVWPESLGAMLEYWYIERGLLSQNPAWMSPPTQTFLGLSRVPPHERGEERVTSLRTSAWEASPAVAASKKSGKIHSSRNLQV